MNWKWSVPKRLLRAPSFRIAYTLALIPPLAFLAWAFTDAHFWNWTHTFLGILGIGWPRVETLSAAWHWYDMRMIIMPSLIGVSAITAVIVAVRLFIGTKRDRSLLSWMLATLLIGVWVGTLFGIVRYPEAQLRYRLRRDMWRFQTVADAITTAGKKLDSTKSEIGEIGGDIGDMERFPGAFRPFHRRSIYEDVEKIWTLEEGALLFTISPSRVALEFHPRGTRPGQRFSKHKYGFEGIRVLPLEELGEGWFLVRRHQP